ncbi:MAG: CoA transferase [Alphaproteobacteria bacterium]|nr:CoA transferase [Alphaproteobacteria bacterium]
MVPCASTALNGITVLDLTRARAGPTAARQLADWGAKVIKIETPEAAGDPDGTERHDSDFQNLHRNKRSVVLDLKTPAGRQAFLRLADQADVVIENFRPAVKSLLGIDDATLRQRNPRLIYASISGFGQTGPYAQRPGFDQIAQGMGGLMSITGYPGQGPLRVGIPVCDLSAGLLCANGILVALLERERSGAGQWVQTSLLEAQIFMLDFQAARWLIDRVVPEPAGNDHPTRSPMGVFATRDGHINIAVSGDAIWRRLCLALGAPDLADRIEFATGAQRLRHRAALHGEIERLLAMRDSATWITRLNDAGVPSGPIYRIDEVFADPHVVHLGIAQSVVSPALGPLRLVGQGVSLNRTPSRVATAAPERGVGTAEVLAEFGFSPDEIAALGATADT